MSSPTPRGSVWVADTLNDSRIFDSRLTYNKGAYLLHMIRFRLQNDSLFFAVLRAYLALQGGQTALAGDLRQVLEQATGQSWATFFQQWYYGEGHPIFSARWNSAGGGICGWNFPSKAAGQRAWPFLIRRWRFVWPDKADLIPPCAYGLLSLPRPSTYLAWVL
ncbi:MAG: hypothetical protein KatS3mg026_1504 [Bacteroidia bacterium]|nr:MAG: hypothetical protein KatS3mg026_1504 [Bacteroidia bacterium]